MLSVKCFVLIKGRVHLLILDSRFCNKCFSKNAPSTRFKFSRVCVLYLESLDIEYLAHLGTVYFKFRQFYQF